MKKWLITLGLAFALTACGSSDPDEVVESPTDEETTEEEVAETETDNSTFEIAVIPSQSTGEMQTGLDNLQSYLTEELEREVVVTQYPNYNAVVEALNYNHVDLAFLGPLTYVIAHEQSGAKAIVTIEVDGSSFYHSYIITHADNEWANLDELLADAGEVDFAFGSISSTSGHLIPGLHLRDLGYYESEDQNEFNQVQFAGSHDVVATLVQNQDVDAGAIDSAILNELIEQGTVSADEIKILWESQELYQYPWVVPAQTSDELVTQLQEAFFAIEDPEILSIFGGATKFVEAEDSNYSDIVDAAREFNMLTLE
ncbi:phosphate/phosphite/phosphonate ABC transporter substrate-binding protein [Bacillus suaedae]|uniref:Phosphate/phosphite/phosphonate ABC transporter substrate-binding protein n=1 Tax=Halalkalibacter suaedae TaxID=2822140 RepID=A0A940WUY0_9BACI|nr:phosphate/phosphite/phosphonate ABC transporter substrate-binding protein [Bacillus suaedae]MBP3952895.1 phosphate/phosphite/phosphonate ABC transporter substrate-binding protein [Bacillus suaedae]